MVSKMMGRRELHHVISRSKFIHEELGQILPDRWWYVWSSCKLSCGYLLTSVVIKG